VGRVPRDAFERFVEMGPSVTYSQLAKKLGVSKRSIVRHASAEGWQERLRKIEEDARHRTNERLTENLDDINERHLRTLRVIQHRALQGLQSLPLKTGMDCVRALTLAVKAERSIVRPSGERDSGPSLVDILTQANELDDRRTVPRDGVQPSSTWDAASGDEAD